MKAMPRREKYLASLPEDLKKAFHFSICERPDMWQAKQISAVCMCCTHARFCPVPDVANGVFSLLFNYYLDGPDKRRNKTKAWFAELRTHLQNKGLTP